jgi:integrase
LHWARQLALHARNPNTTNNTTSLQKNYQEFCRLHSLSTSSPDSLATHLADKALTVKAGHLANIRSACRKLHHRLRQPCPLSDDILTSSRRLNHDRRPASPHALPLNQLLSLLPPSPQDLEHVAMLTLGWATMARPSDLSNLSNDSVRNKTTTLKVTFPFSKNHPGHARTVYLTHSPLTAPTQRYLVSRATHPGTTPLFPTLDVPQPAKVVAQALKTLLPGTPWGGKALRYGGISHAFDQGCTLPQVMAVSGHKTVSSALNYFHQRTTQHHVTDLLHNQPAFLPRTHSKAGSTLQ